MRTTNRLPLIFATIALLLLPLAAVRANSCDSTRVVDKDQYSQTTKGGYPYREKSDYVSKELDLKPGDVVVDIGAGDGWWSEKMAEAVGPKGTIYAGEVTDDKVEKMKKKFADVPQVKPYRCPLDSTGLEENTCDLAFLSKSYHHLDKDGQVKYLKGLCSVIKPTGRLVVIEHYQELAKGRAHDHAWSPGLLTQQAEQAGWILVRCEMITGTNHFIAIFVQKELFGVD